MADCTECRYPCELHGITRCLTCHNHPGECEYGGCTRPQRGGGAFEYVDPELHGCLVGGVGRYCRVHSDDPRYGWLHAGTRRLEDGA